MNSFQQACSPSCAIDYGRVLIDRQNKRELRRARARIKPRSRYLAEAQKVFNAWVRERDRLQPCISCGKPASDEPNTWDCGHFRTVGAAPELRFNQLNAHRQCKSCNGGHFRKSQFVVSEDRKESIRSAYRENLIRRIGLENVEWLEGPHEPVKYTKDDLIQIRIKFAEKLKTLKARH